MHLDIVKKIKRLRLERELSLLQMAEKLNIEISAYTRLESGKTITWAKYLKDILNIFGISLSSFFRDIEIEYNYKSLKSDSQGDVFEGFFEDNKGIVKRIEEAYEEKLKNKDLTIIQLQKIIDRLLKL